MKHLLLPNARKLWILTGCLAVFSFNHALAGGMSGPYTIGSSGTYTSFTKAIADLTTNGVSGPVTFTVAAGTYNEQPVIGKITGASATNTITFVGQSDSSKVILTSASSSSSTTNYTLELSNSRFVTFKKITVNRTGVATYSTAVYLTANTYHCQFQGCLITTKFDPASSVAMGNPCVYSDGIDTGNAYNGCRVKHGYNCIGLAGAGDSNTVSNNIIDSGGMAGFYCTGIYQVNLVITKNTFNAGNATLGATSSTLAYGVRFESSSVESFSVTKNRFYATSTTASTCRCLVMFFAGVNQAGTRNLIANNFFWVSAGTSGSTGITLGGGTNIDVVYNSVLMTSSPTTPGAALYIYPTSYTGSGITVRDNNLINTGGGFCIDNEADSAAVGGIVTGLAIEDYNDLYTTGSYVAYYRGSKYTTLANYSAACKLSGADAHSISLYPGYVSNTDLHSSSSGVYQAGTPFPTVTDDIDGDPRPSVKPCIGADEFTPAALDAGITALDSPTVSFCYPVTKNIFAKFTNFGSSTLTSLTLNWSVNGIAQTPYSWTGSVGTGLVSSSIKVGSFLFNSKNPYSLKIWVSAPNGGTDQKATNDTLFKTVSSGLSGTYYLGGTSPDFTSFNAFLGALNTYGICGPTVVRVRNGTYSEQLTVPNIPAMSSVNTVTFQSDAGDSSKVILTQASSSTSAVGVNGNNSTIQLNAAKWFTFKQMTIQKTGTLITEQVIEFINGANNNSFLNCKLIGCQAANSSTGDIVYQLTDKDTLNTFNNNLFKYGYYGINLVSPAATHSADIAIIGNTFDSSYAGAITLSYCDSVIVRSNTITNTNYIAGANYGISLTGCNNGIRITKNKVMMPFGGSGGINATSCLGRKIGTGFIANNFISLATNATYTSPYGLYNNSSTYQDYYFNSVIIYNTNTGSAFYTNMASGNLNVTDNILANTGGGFAIVSTTSTSPFTGTDYNDIYTSGTNVGSYNGTADASLSAWQTASGMASHSLSTKPYFPSVTNYHTYNLTLQKAGLPNIGILTDIDGKTRSITTPSMGALEILQSSNDAGISAITLPAASACVGTSNVTVTLANGGTSVLKSATIGWSVNGTAQTSYSYSGGNIASNGTASVTIGSFTFATGKPVIKVWASNPNGKVDSFAGNDTFSATITINALPAANAGSAAVVCKGTAVNIGAAAVKLSTYSWSSNPTGFSSTVSNPSVAPTVATTYTVTEINSNGCTASNTVAVTLSASPAANPGNPATICSGNTIQIGAPSVAGSTYSWSSSGSFSSASSNPYATPGVTTTYTLTETNAGGCSTTNAVVIKVNALPAANAGSSATICSGSSVAIGATAVGTDGYLWQSIPSGFLSLSANPTVSPTVTTTYIVYETNATTGCQNLGAAVVTVSAPPAANAGAPATVCLGSSTKIGPTATTGNSYSWTSSSGFTSAVSNPTVTPTATSTYTLVETTAGGCSNTGSVKITVNSLPTTTISSASTSACTGNPINVTVSSPGIGYSYQWYLNGVAVTGIAAKTNNFASASGDYKALGIDGNGCSAMSNDIVITFNSLPVSSGTAFGSTTRCAGDSVLMVQPLTAGSTYQWSVGGVSIMGATKNEYEAKADGSYTVVETNSNGCVSDPTGTGVQVNFNTLPTASISPNAKTICSGGKVLLLTNSVPGINSQWLMNNTPISGATSTSYSATESGSYNVINTSTTTGCSITSATAGIVVNPTPTAIINPLSSTKICSGGNVLLTAESIEVDSYQWGASGIPVSGATSDTFTAKGAGTYSLTVTNASGCSATSLPVTVSEFTQPTVSLIVPKNVSVCQGATVSLHSTSTGTISADQWWLDGNAISGAANDSIKAGSSGTYSLMVTSADGCHATSTGAKVTVNALPVAKFDMSSNSVCAGSSVAFYDASTLAATDNWDFGTGDNSTQQNPVYTFKTAGSFNVNLTVTSSAGCTASLKNAVTVLNTNASTFTAVHQGFRRMLMTPTDLTGTSYSWNFGDNVVDTTKTPTHQYASDGTYKVTLTVTNANGCSTTTTSNIVVNATGINQAVENDVTIKVFPNPFEGSTNVTYTLNQSATVAIEVYDMLGKLVTHVESSKQVSGDHIFTFNGEMPGTYFIRLIINGLPYTSKVVKQN